MASRSMIGRAAGRPAVLEPGTFTPNSTGCRLLYHMTAGKRPAGTTTPVIRHLNHLGLRCPNLLLAEIEGLVT